MRSLGHFESRFSWIYPRSELIQLNCNRNCANLNIGLILNLAPNLMLASSDNVYIPQKFATHTFYLSLWTYMNLFPISGSNISSILPYNNKMGYCWNVLIVCPNRMHIVWRLERSRKGAFTWTECLGKVMF